MMNKKIVTFAGRKVIIKDLKKVSHDQLHANVDFRNRQMTLLQRYHSEDERELHYEELMKNLR